MQIRNAEAADLNSIVDIYNQSVPSRSATADTEPIAVADRLSWYRDRSCNRPLWVMTESDRIIGWLSWQNFYGRPAYRHTAEISIYVATDYHYRGVGSKLLEQAIVKSPELHLSTLLAFIFAHNQPSLQLFTKYGFEQWGYLPDVAQLDNVRRSLIILGRKI